MSRTDWQKTNTRFPTSRPRIIAKVFSRIASLHFVDLDQQTNFANILFGFGKSCCNFCVPNAMLSDHHHRLIRPHGQLALKWIFWLHLVWASFSQQKSYPTWRLLQFPHKLFDVTSFTACTHMSFTSKAMRILWMSAISLCCSPAMSLHVSKALWLSLCLSLLASLCLSFSRHLYLSLFLSNQKCHFLVTPVLLLDNWGGHKSPPKKETPRLKHGICKSDMKRVRVLL